MMPRNAAVTATPTETAVTTKDSNGAELPIGIVMQATDLTVDFSEIPEFRVYTETATGLDDLKAGEINELFVILPDYVATGHVEYYYTNDEGAGRQQLRLILTDCTPRRDSVARAQGTGTCPSAVPARHGVG